MDHFNIELDKTLAFLGLVISIVLSILMAILGHPINVLVGTLLCIFCATYLIIRKPLSSFSLSSLDLAKGSYKLYAALNIIFFVLLVADVLIFLFRPDPYIRPVTYFTLYALMVSVISVEILFLPTSKACEYFVLFKILIIGLNITSSQLFMFPGVVGIDPWFHQFFTLNILQTGHIPGGYSYSGLPIMHLLINSIMVVTPTYYKMATYLSVSVPFVICDAIFTFLLGKLMFNKKVGLLGALLVNTAAWPITLSYWVIPNTLAATFILPIIYLLLKMKNNKSRVILSLTMLLMATVILTHTLTAMFLAILLVIFFVGEIQNGKLIRVDWKTSVPFRIVLLFIVGMFAWWVFVSGSINTLAQLIKTLFNSTNFVTPIPAKVLLYANNVPFFEQIFNYSGLLLFFFISLTGCFYAFSRKGQKSGNSRVIAGGLVILGISFSSQLIGFFIVPERWFFFSQILLALPLSLSFFLFCHIAKKNLVKGLLMLALTFSLVFLMIVNPMTNLDQPIFSPNTQVRYAFTASELEAINTLSFWNRTIGTDTYYCSLGWSSHSLVDISTEILSGNYSNDQSMIVLMRGEVVNHPFLLFQSVYKIDYDSRTALSVQGFSRVYDCGSATAFLYSDQ